jgi:hypothetical protein
MEPCDPIRCAEENDDDDGEGDDDDDDESFRPRAWGVLPPLAPPMVLLLLPLLPVPGRLLGPPLAAAFEAMDEKEEEEDGGRPAL